MPSQCWPYGKDVLAVCTLTKFEESARLGLMMQWKVTALGEMIFPDLSKPSCSPQIRNDTKSLLCTYFPNTTETYSRSKPCTFRFLSRFTRPMLSICFRSCIYSFFTSWIEVDFWIGFNPGFDFLFLSSKENLTFVCHESGNGWKVALTPIRLDFNPPSVLREKREKREWRCVAVGGPGSPFFFHPLSSSALFFACQINKRDPCVGYFWIGLKILQN